MYSNPCYASAIVSISGLVDKAVGFAGVKLTKRTDL